MASLSSFDSDGPGAPAPPEAAGKCPPGQPGAPAPMNPDRAPPLPPSGGRPPAQPPQQPAAPGVPGARVYGVGELTRYIGSVLGNDPVLQEVWVKGEVSNFHHHQASGHMYFDLKDEDAVLHCIMFREANRRLAFKMEHGQKLLLRGNIIVYAARGEYELRVMEARPEGLGALYLAFEQLKKRLEA